MVDIGDHPVPHYLYRWDIGELYRLDSGEHGIDLQFLCAISGIDDPRTLTLGASGDDCVVFTCDDLDGLEERCTGDNYLGSANALLGCDPRSGRVAWMRELPIVSIAPVVRDGVIYCAARVGTGNFRLYVLDSATGNTLQSLNIEDPWGDSCVDIQLLVGQKQCLVTLSGSLSGEENSSQTTIVEISEEGMSALKDIPGIDHVVASSSEPLRLLCHDFPTWVMQEYSWPDFLLLSTENVRGNVDWEEDYFPIAYIDESTFLAGNFAMTVLGIFSVVTWEKLSEVNIDGYRVFDGGVSDLNDVHRWEVYRYGKFFVLRIWTLDPADYNSTQIAIIHIDDISKALAGDNV